jgi:hypothetical protein
VVSVRFARFDYQPAILDFLLGIAIKALQDLNTDRKKIIPDPGSSGFEMDLK